MNRPHKDTEAIAFFSLWFLRLPAAIAGMLICSGLGLAASTSAAPPPYTESKPRLLVLTDIGQDPDDEQSFIRLLLYADAFDIEGLVATADNNSKREPAVVREDLLYAFIDAYAKVLPNLRRHRPAFPDANHLRSRVRTGSDRAGVAVPVDACIGPGFDTAGSDWIAERILADDPRPLNIAVWGGAVDLAQALFRLHARVARPELDRLLQNTRVYFITWQDRTNLWIMEQFPALPIVFSLHPSGDSLKSTFRGMFIGGDLSTLTRDWIRENIHGHGPLGDLYPTRTWTGGPERNPHEAVKEGDTPSFFFFLQNGLNDPRHPDYGGWGGRFLRRGNLWTDAADSVKGETSARATVYRWRPAFQADFQARLDWCVRSPEEANHPPEVVINGDSGRAPLEIWTDADARLVLDAGATRDPDGDSLRFRWWHYPEPSSFADAPDISDATSRVLELTPPARAAGFSTHLVLEVTDDGDPALTAYRRVVVHVRR